MARRTKRASHRWDPIAINDAFNELTKTEFAVWIRLCTMSPNQQAIGRNKLYRILNYQVQRPSDTILRQLSDKGYILFEPKGIGKPTAVLIVKRPRISSTHLFVKV
jgi:hypothetical protein